MTTFTRSAKTYDAETGVMSITASTIEGDAIQVQGDPARYMALNLNITENPTLFFVPDTYGDKPEPGDTVVWPASGRTFTVRDVSEIAPDGVLIAARIVVGR